MAWSCHFNGLP